MKRAITALLVLWVICVSAVVWAAPVSTFSATAPTQYEDGTMIDPAQDTLGFTLWCGNAAGGAYPYSYDVPSLDPGQQVDISSCVQSTPGTYYFVATSRSSLHGTTSVNSNETLRTYTASDLGKNPLAPTLLTIS